MSDLNIAMILRLVDQVTGPSRRVLSSMREVGGSVTSVADRLDGAAQRQIASMRGQVIEVGALSASIYAAVRPAIQFETAMAGINKVVDFETPDALKALGQEIQNLSTSGGIAQTATDIAAIIEEAGKANLINKDLGIEALNAEMIEFARNTAQMAVAFEIPAQLAGQTMAIWKNALGMGTEESLIFADAINHTANNIGTTEAKLIDMIGYVGATAKSAGLATTEIVGLSAAILSAGASPERAATGLKNFTNALTRGASATDRQLAIFEQLGLDATEMAERMQVDAKGAIIDVLERLRELPAAVQNAAIGDLFGQEATSAITPLIGNLDNLRASFDLVADPAEFAGAMLREFEAQSGTTENQIKLLINNVNALVTTFTTELLPAIKDVIQAVAPFLQQMREWVSANPELVAALGQAALALLGFKAASLAVSVALVGIIKPVALVAKGIGLLLSVVAVANPFSLLIAGAALLTAAIFAPWDEIGAYIDGKLSGISLYDSGKAMIQTLWSGAKGVIPRMVADIKARIAGILPDWLSNYLSGGGGDSAAPDAAVDMTGPLRPPRADGTYTQNNTITITPHPNQNPEAIANEVIRQQARRGRGGPAMPHLYDTPEDAQ